MMEDTNFSLNEFFIQTGLVECSCYSIQQHTNPSVDLTSHFFMYYEDVDICERIWKSENILVGDLSIRVIHDAQRASRKNFKHMLWHLSSMIRYLWRYR